MITNLKYKILSKNIVILEKVETFAEICFLHKKITATRNTVNLNLCTFKFKNTKFFTSIIIFIIADVRIWRFLIYGNFTEMEQYL